MDAASACVEPFAQVFARLGLSDRRDEFDADIVELPQHARSFVARVSAHPGRAPPEDVKAPLLKARLHCAGCFGSAAHQLMNAVVRCNDPDAAWRISRSCGKPLDIDLGTTCRIDAFATQGRAPATRIYPHVGYDTLTGEHTVEDAEYLPKAPSGKSARYGGPWWRVLSTPYDGLPSWQPGAYHEPAWCGRYELLWRAAGGRAAPLTGSVGSRQIPRLCARRRRRSRGAVDRTRTPSTRDLTRDAPVPR